MGGVAIIEAIIMEGVAKAIIIIDLIVTKDIAVDPTLDKLLLDEDEDEEALLQPMTDCSVSDSSWPLNVWMRNLPRNVWMRNLPRMSLFKLIGT